MGRTIVLALALAACGSSHAYRHPGRPTPTWRYAVDGTATAVAFGLSADGYTRDRDAEMALGFGLLAVFWLPYWFVESR